MSSVARKLLQVQPSAAEAASDDDFANVVLLLDGDGTSGDNNETFTDSGSVGATITENGDVIQGSFSPYGDNWSWYFEAGQYMYTPVTGQFLCGTTTDFTVELWYCSSGGYTPALYDTFVAQWPAGSPTTGKWLMGLTASGYLMFMARTHSSTATLLEGTTDITDGKWHHLAVTRSGTTFRLFVDGTQEDTVTGTDTVGITEPITVNSYGAGFSQGYEREPEGWISNLRLIEGTNLYTSDFTPPTSPLTAVTNTEFLTCQSNRFLDNSSNGFSFTINGTPKVTPFSPFKDDDARDITTDGGSVLFGPSGDYLQLPSNSAYNATSSLCAECWFYMVGAPSSGPSAHCPMSKWASTTLGQRSWFFDIENTGIRMRVDTSNNSAGQVVVDNSTGALNRYAWYHIALTWDGSTYRGFLNGELIGSLSDSAAPRGTSQVIRIGYNLNTHYMDGYVSDCRVLVNQGAVYTSAFTPPTAPLGNFTGTANTLNYVEYENKSFSVASEETNPQGVRFKSDGTKMYVIGNTGDDVGQYSLSTAWDVSTASFDSVTLSVSSQDGTPNGIAFSSDGAEMYISGNDNNKVFQYDLSTPWDLSTASYANKSLATQGTNPIEPFMRSNGTDFYCLDNNSEAVFQYSLSTANDISTATYASKTISVASQETTPTGLAFSSDGTKMFVCGQVGDDVNQYTLSTAWDISTASFDNRVFSFTGQTTNPAGIDLKPDGTKLYMISNSGDAVYQYDLAATKQPEVLLNFQDSGIYDRSGINNIDTVGNAQIDTAVKKYGTGSLNFDGSGDILRNENPNDLALGTGDFTVEFWLNVPDVSATQIFFDMRHDSNTNDALTVFVSSGFKFYAGTSSITIGTISNDTWHHIAIVRDGSTIRSFIDGVAGGTESNTNDLTCEEFRIGAGWDDGSPMTGYIDDFRITKGIARYTSAFTPPTAAHGKF